ncbi:MAG TPA: molecular chaperone TorD family protein [Candidatus Methylomirabilis sp.]|nr:molecular chaperone TorD family protein [Candidatus Methylomirabilis sp.]
MNDVTAFQAPSAAESEEAASRGRAYGFLAWLILEGPDTPFLERMLGGEVAAYLASLAASGSSDPLLIAGLEEMRGWLAGNADGPLEQLRQELAVQGTWLFKGIAPGYGPPPPYEAVHRRPGAGADADILLSLRGFYREAAADLPCTSRERLDHLGLELDFMRFLCEEESRLWGSGNACEAARFRRIQRRFLAAHLTPWVPGYCQRLLEEQCAPFFHGLARVLLGFLAGEVALRDSGPGGGDGPELPGPASIQ